MATAATRQGRHCIVVPTTVPQASPDVINDPVVPVVPAGQPAPLELPAAPAATRTNRNHHAPAWYRDAAADSEYIDIGVVGESSSNNNIVADGTQAQPSSSGLPCPHTIPAAQTTPNPASTTSNPLATSGRSKVPPTSADIHHFFKKSKSEDTVCNVCQANFIIGSRQMLTAANSIMDSSSVATHPTTHFAATSQIGTSKHMYLKLVEKNDWSVQIEAVQGAISMGYTFRILREAVQ
ncbi:hypothetical protein EV363DRAFT_1293430 [Boletus edulis]|nr:hypothetical protein EV363DRAFT_1293430 [Boletus edulis]